MGISDRCPCRKFQLGWEMKVQNITTVDDTQKEASLWKQYRKQKDPEHRKVLTTFYLPFVRIIAASIFARLKLSGLEFADYVSYGVVGLFDAIERFREEEIVRFKGYAAFRIKGEIYNGIVKFTDKAQFEAYKRRLLVERASSINREIKQLNKETKFEEILKLSSLLIMGEVINDNDALEEVEQESSYISIESESIYLKVCNKLKFLNETEMLVICYHYMSDLPFKEISELLSISKSRVSQIHVRALSQLKHLITHSEVFEKII